MNIITRSGVAARRTASGTIYQMPPVRLPIYLHIALLILTVTAVIMVGWMVLVRQNIQPANPFASYAEIFPGHARDSFIKFSCSSFPETSATAHEYCTQAPENGPFWLISATLKQGVVQRTDFGVRDSTLTLGDLIFLWGRPKVRLYRESATIKWENLGITGTGRSQSRQFSYFMPVTRISIGPSWNQPVNQAYNYWGRLSIVSSFITDLKQLTLPPLFSATHVQS